jgi:hypothetical protein
MLRASVPKAAIDQNGDLSVPKNNIRDAPRLSKDFDIHSVAQSVSVYFAPQFHFGLRTALTHLRHATTGLRG